MFKHIDPTHSWMSALYRDKSMAFDLVADDILNIKTSEEGDEGEGILYLGDSK
jgi:hypothetical protein